MNIHARIAGLTCSTILISTIHNPFSQFPSRFYCSRRDPKESRLNGDSKGDRSSTDWDKAWRKFKKQGKKTLFSNFSPNKYVTWDPPSSDFPLSEETNPIKKAERSNLMLWTSPKFTLAGAIVIVTILLVYSILALVK